MALFLQPLCLVPHGRVSRQLLLQEPHPKMRCISVRLPGWPGLEHTRHLFGLIHGHVPPYRREKARTPSTPMFFCTPFTWFVVDLQVSQCLVTLAPWRHVQLAGIQRGHSLSSHFVKTLNRMFRSPHPIVVMLDTILVRVYTLCAHKKSHHTLDERAVRPRASDPISYLFRYTRKVCVCCLPAAEALCALT